MQKLRTAKVQPSLSLDTTGGVVEVTTTAVAKTNSVQGLSADRLDLPTTASRSKVRSIKAKPKAGTLGDGHPPVAVVGAGPTGLATAILLAQSGVPVEILEKRLDPEGPEGRRENQQAAELFQQAHQAAQRNQTTVADKLLAQAEAHHNKVACGRSRTVLLDRPTIRAFEALGLDVSSIPEQRHLKVIREGEQRPWVELDYHADGASTGDRPDSPELLLGMRDLSHQVQLGTLEQLLLDVARREPLINLRFGAELNGVKDATGGKQLSLANGETLTAREVAVTGNNSFLEQLGVPWSKHGHEEHWLNAVLEVPTSGRFFDKRAGIAGGVYEVRKSKVVVGYNNDGQGHVSINALVPPGVEAPDLVAIARGHGLRGKVIGRQQAFGAQVQTAPSQVAPGVFPLGDALERAGPMVGQGVQMGLQSAEAFAARYADRQEDGLPSSEATQKYLDDVGRLKDLRVGVETLLQRAADNTVGGLGPVVGLLAMPGLMKALSNAEISYTKTGPHSARLSSEHVFDLGRLAGELDPGLASIAKSMGLATMTTEGVDVALNGRRASLRLSPEHPFVIKNGLEDLRFTGGHVELEQRDDDGWSLHSKDLRIQRKAHESGAETTLHVEDFQYNLPAEFSELLLEGLASKPAINTLPPLDMVAHEVYSPGQIHLGKAEIKLAGDPQVKLKTTLKTNPDGTRSLEVACLEGWMAMQNVGDYNLEMKPSPWLARLGRLYQSVPLWGGLVATPLINMLGKIHHVRHVKMDLQNDGSVIAEFDHGYSKYHLSAQDVGEVLRMFKGQEQGNLMSLLGAHLSSMRVELSAPDRA